MFIHSSLVWIRTGSCHDVVKFEISYSSDNNINDELQSKSGFPIVGSWEDNNELSVSVFPKGVKVSELKQFSLFIHSSLVWIKISSCIKDVKLEIIILYGDKRNEETQIKSEFTLIGKYLLCSFSFISADSGLRNEKFLLFKIDKLIKYFNCTLSSPFDFSWN